MKYNMSRFHIVVSNYKRISSFVENFSAIHGFNYDQDSVYIFDCSPESDYRSELRVVNRLCCVGLEWNKNLFFIRRRNWGVNHGAQLDYFRAILNGLIRPGTLVAFMQEHFLDLKNFVKEDTLPENAIYDLDEIANKFDSDPQIGCVFHSRYGVRVSASNPVRETAREFYGDGEFLLDKAVRRGFLIDGGNFIARPQYYINWFKNNQDFLTQGDGSYGFSHVWETRLGQILYDQEIKWCDIYRNLEYSTVSDLDDIEKKSSQKVSKLWYDNRIWYFFYGRDQQVYLPIPFKSFLKYLIIFIQKYKTYSRDTTLTFVRP